MAQHRQSLQMNDLRSELRTGENPLELFANRRRVHGSRCVVDSACRFPRLHGSTPPILANERLEYSTRTVSYLRITVPPTVRPSTLTVPHLPEGPPRPRLL